MQKAKDYLVHRIFRVPYALNVVIFRSPKKPVHTIVLLHGIGNTVHSWDSLINSLPDDIRVIGVDLLGFGKSPKPSWVQYSAKTHARSLGVTLIKMGLLQRVTLVGHSMGALVSIEVARRYPVVVDKLVLCSPPFYKKHDEKSTKADDILRDIYKAASKKPEALVKLSPLVVRVGLANKSLDINSKNVDIYIETLRTCVINQNALYRAAGLKVPTKIIYGALDPVVIGRHIEELACSNQNITTRKILAGHELVGRYLKILSEEINKFIYQKPDR